MPRKKNVVTVQLECAALVWATREIRTEQEWADWGRTFVQALATNEKGINQLADALISQKSYLYRKKPNDWGRRRIAVFRRDGMKCVYCGAINVTFECDHIVPKTLGGSDEIINLATSCVRCNRSKGKKLIEEWIGAPLV